jgi:hypothetical protein
MRSRMNRWRVMEMREKDENERRGNGKRRKRE